MIRLFLTVLLAFTCWGPCLSAAPSCSPLSGDQITGRDLATAVPQLAVLPPDLKFGYAPVPGASRSIPAAQLQQLANRYGLATRITESVCFAWPLHLLSKDELLAALKRSLGDHQAELQITDQSHVLVPDGELSFPMQGLSSDSDKPAVWNGYVTYAGGRKFNTWVQVRIIIHEQQVIAARQIQPGEVVDISAIRAVEYAGPLKRTITFQKEEQVAGKCARWSIAAGTVLTASMIAMPKDIEKEQLITVHIDCGAAHIETQGIASEPGYKGDIIRVRNPKTGRVFRARVDDRGVATVVPGGNIGLVVEDRKS